MPNKKGFTLIEILVVVAILGIISTMGYVAYSRAQMVARDGKRKQDLKSIQVALELYSSKYGRYPCTQGDSNGIPLTPSGSGGTFSFMDLNSYNANGTQNFWLKDDGCGGVHQVGTWNVNTATWTVNGTPTSVSVLDPTSVKPFDSQFINEMSSDPLKNDYPYMRIGVDNSYGYYYFTPNPNYNTDYNNHQWPIGHSYVLWAKLENADDADSCRNKDYKTCAGVDFCTGKSQKMYVIFGCGP